VIAVLVGVQDVSAMLEEQARDTGDQASAVWAVAEQNGRFFHAPYSLIPTRRHLRCGQRPLAGNSYCTGYPPPPETRRGTVILALLFGPRDLHHSTNAKYVIVIRASGTSAEAPFRNLCFPIRCTRK